MNLLKFSNPKRQSTVKDRCYAVPPKEKKRRKNTTTTGDRTCEEHIMSKSIKAITFTQISSLPST